MKNSGIYYKQLCEELVQRIKLLEAMIASKKNSKLDPVGQEDADIDNDGKPNTSRDKYLKNRRKKIGQAMKGKKQTIKEGTVVTDGNIFYGGFPKKLNEQGLVNQYNDADDAPGEPSIAALTDELEKMKSTLDQASYELDEPQSAFRFTGKGRAMVTKIADLEKRIRSHPDYKKK
jgi:hypothetical protein